MRLYWLITAGIVTGSYIIALSVQSLDKVLAIVGATGSTTICYILPGLFYYRLYQHQPWNRTKLGAVGLVALGFIIMFGCLGSRLFL
jgi:amino acid permease